MGLLAVIGQETFSIPLFPTKRGANGPLHHTFSSIVFFGLLSDNALRPPFVLPTASGPRKKFLRRASQKWYALAHMMMEIEEKRKE